MNDDLIRIGKFTHHRSQLRPDAWTFGRARDAFHAVWSAANGYSDLKAQLREEGKLTPQGILDKLRTFRGQRGVLNLLHEGEEAAQLAVNAVAAKKSALRDALAQKLDPKSEAKRAEIRMFLRSIDQDQRIQLALKPEFQEAILDHLPALSGLPDDVYARVENVVFERAFPGQITQAQAEAESGEMLRQAISGLRAQLREDDGQFAADEAQATEARRRSA